jgi:hypothetical protein
MKEMWEDIKKAWEPARKTLVSVTCIGFACAIIIIPTILAVSLNLPLFLLLLVPATPLVILAYHYHDRYLNKEEIEANEKDTIEISLDDIVGIAIEINYQQRTEKLGYKELCSLILLKLEERRRC